VPLVVHQGGTGSNLVRVVFADEAAGPLVTGPSTFSGEYQPYSPLSRFAGRSAQGTWQLEVSDTAAEPRGTLLSWNLFVRPA
jgi:hypothetical protein